MNSIDIIEKFGSILQIDPKTIHEELWESVLDQLQDRQSIFVMPVISFDLLVHYVIIFNCFDKLSAMIYIQNYS